MPFDPYHTWLGIRPEEQPPNHYRLLGLSLFEDNPAVIDHAADRQMAHVRTFQSGPHAGLSQRLLSEITLARICLINPQKRAAYDMELRKTLQPPPAQPPLAETQPIVVTVPLSPTGEDRAAPSIIDRSAADGPGPAGRRKNPAVEIAKIVAGGLAGIVISVLLLRYVARIDITGLLPVPKKVDSGQVVQRPIRIDPLDEKTKGVLTPTTPITTSNATPVESSPPMTTAADEENSSAAEEPPTSKQAKKRAKKKAPTSSTTPSSPSLPVPSPPASPASPIEPPMLPAHPAVLLAKRLPAPTSAEQEAIKKTLEELYGISRLKTEADKLKVASDLRNVARDAKDKPAEQFVALRQAAELAQEAGNASLVAECIDALAQRFEIDVLNAEAAMLVQCAQNARTSEAIETLVTATKPTVIFALAEGEIDTAKRLTDATMVACNRPNGLKFRKLVSDGQKEINRQHVAWKAYQQAILTLQAQPDDAAANLKAGEWLATERNDWAAALPYLARSGNPLLQKAAELDQAKPTAADALVVAADAWFDAGKAPPDEPLWRLRARSLYQRAKSGGLEGLLAARVDRRLEELAKDPDVQALMQGAGKLTSTGRLRRELSPIIRRHCILAFMFEAGDIYSAADKPMLRDRSGQENHGLIHGTTVVAGRAGSAFQFQSESDYVESPDQPSLNPKDSFTICAWIYQHSPVRPGGADDIVSKEEFGGGTGSGFSLRLHDRMPDFNFGSGSEWMRIRAPHVVEPGKWMHLAGVYDGQYEAMFVDGAEVASMACTKPMSVSPRPVRVGRGPFAQDRRFQGIIDEVAMFNIALTTDDIRTIYELGAAGTPLAD